MATARLLRQTSRTLKVGRVGRTGRVPPAARGTGRLEARRNGPIIDTSRLSRIARRRIASPPMAAVDRVGEAVYESVYKWAEAFIARVMRDVVPSIVKADATEDDIDAILNALDDPELSRKLMEEAFKSVDKASADDLRVVGVQTNSVVRNAEELQAEWLRQSTDLIRATEDVRRRVERILKDPVSEGRSVADIRGMLIEQAGYAASRAELTARTVTLQTYGKIQEQRQRDAGFTKYVWTTSLDERVREDHAELDGTVQEWDSPPIADKRSGRRGHPGSDFQCRCSAVPYAEPDEVLEPVDAQPEPTAREIDTDRLESPTEARERSNIERATRAHARLSETQQAALADYTSFEHDTFQALQQGLTTSEVSARLGIAAADVEATRAKLPALRSALDELAIANPTKRGPLYRGVALTDAEFERIVQSGQVDFRSATNSTTYSASVAVDFAVEAPGIYSTPERQLSKRVVFRIRDVDRGAPVMHEGNVLAQQQEVLVGRSQYRVAGRAYDSTRDVWVLDLEQVGSSTF